MKHQNQNRPSLGCHKWQVSLALVFFLCLFCVVVHFFWLLNMCFVVRFSFPYQAMRLACETSLKWPTLCWVGLKTTTQSISCNMSLEVWRQRIYLLERCKESILESDLLPTSSARALPIDQFTIHRLPWQMVLLHTHDVPDLAVLLLHSQWFNGNVASYIDGFPCVEHRLAI